VFLIPDGTLFVQLINFAIFFAILNAVFLRPVGAAIRKRRAYIDGVKNDTERFVNEARALREEAERKRAAARREADESHVKARSEADAQAAQIGATFGDRANAIANKARATVEAELQTARKREDELAGALAKTLLERAVGAAR
jgi:F0F1-type ATP synthase membrane subunit b/b'